MALTPTGLANEIEAAFKANWPTATRGPLPAGTEADRGLLFNAIAIGLLKYLEAHQNDLIDTIRMTEAGLGTRDYTVVTANLDITGI